MNDFYLVRKNLTRNKLRLVLNAFAIFIAFFLFGVLGAIKYAFEAGVEVSGADRLVVVNKISFTQVLPYSYINKTRAVENVKHVTWANWFGGYYEQPRQQAMSFAVDPESYFQVYDDLIADEAALSAWFNNRVGIMVGERLAATYGWKVGDRIPLSSNIFMQANGSKAWEFEVSGIFKGNSEAIDTNYLLMHYKYFMDTQSWGGDYVGWLSVSTKDPEFNEQVIRDIDAQFENSGAETKTDTEAAFQKAFVEQLGDINFILNAVLLAAFFTILLIVGNSMLISVRERTRELAVLKTLGFSAPRVFKMVLSESLLLAFIGGLSGLFCAAVAVQGMAHVPELSRMLPILILTHETTIKALIFMACLGVAAGIIPAYRALKLNTIDALTRG